MRAHAKRPFAVAARVAVPARNAARFEEACRARAQSVIPITKSIGSSVNQKGFPDRESQTVIPRSVSAARSWFEVPKSVQNAM